MQSIKKSQGKGGRKSKWFHFIPSRQKKKEKFSDFGHLSRKQNAEKTSILFFED
jgi:hypothetical protein